MKGSQSAESDGGCGADLRTSLGRAGRIPHPGGKRVGVEQKIALVGFKPLGAKALRNRRREVLDGHCMAIAAS